MAGKKAAKMMMTIWRKARRTADVVVVVPVAVTDLGRGGEVCNAHAFVTWKERPSLLSHTARRGQLPKTTFALTLSFLCPIRRCPNSLALS